MNVGKKDTWEEIIRSKLKDCEVDTQPDDWKAIESRLPDKKVVFARRWYYAAAAIALFLLITGGYMFFRNSDKEVMIAQIEKTGETESITNYEVRITEREEIGEAESITNYEVRITEREEIGEENQLFSYSVTQLISYSVNQSLLPLPSLKTQLEVNPKNPVTETLLSFKQLFRKSPDINQIQDLQYIADAAPANTGRKSIGRWGIGAGGGSYSVGTNGGGFANFSRSDNAAFAMQTLNNGEWYMETPVRRNDNFNDFLSNASGSVSDYSATNISRVDVTHKQPVSFGIGIGYALNNRWTLQSGLVYTFLSSEWRTSLDFSDKYKQQLHFLGVPLGLSYKIADWNKIRFYTTAGVLAEWNISGNIKAKNFYYEDNAYRTEKEYIRMKEMQWSVNARVGANYPIVRFINAYVESGANYYFNNNSSIETIRSDKPFHLSLQAGLRFGF